jgi:hypothetical protein
LNIWPADFRLPDGTMFRSMGALFGKPNNCVGKRLLKTDLLISACAEMAFTKNPAGFFNKKFLPRFLLKSALTVSRSTDFSYLLLEEHPKTRSVFHK